MATSNFQTLKPFSILLAISITFFLLLFNKVNSTEVLSFSFTKFGTNQKNLILQRDALVTSTGKLQLTKVENGKPVYKSLGRALYATPVHIWDNITGNVASFETSFSFVIDAPDSTKTADGLAFFLAPIDTQPQQTGGLLGLFKDRYYNSSNQIVAVEFDTYHNEAYGDPEGPHIGIDVNTIRSEKTSTWGFRNGDVANVVISYQASSKTLVASLVYPSGKTNYITSAAVDLKSIVPQWVRVGFSATTGETEDYIQTNDVLSWSFVSKLPNSNSGVAENDVDSNNGVAENNVDSYSVVAENDVHHASYMLTDSKDLYAY